MRKLIAISLVVVFAVAFGLGVLATPAQAGPNPPYCGPNHWAECIDGHWYCCWNHPILGKICDGPLLDEC